MIKYKKSEVKDFLYESNAIECEYSEQSYEDALKAWNYLKDKSFLTPEVILGAHNFLMKNLRPDIAGFWRNCNVWIGGHKKKFISTQLIEDEVKQLFDAINLSISTLPSNATKEYKEETCKQHHIQYEDVHPHQDGNGRTGRLIYLWERMQLGLPIHIIHAGDEQFSYYSWFK